MTTIDGPFGATLRGDRTDFRVYSLVADAIELSILGDDGSETRHPMQADPGGVWTLEGVPVGAGTRYGFRVRGPYDPARGLRCNPAKLLTDPYAKAVTRQGPWGQRMFSYRLGTDGDEFDATDNLAEAPRSIVVDGAFDWGNDAPPRVPPARTIVYELHVKGFTARLEGVPPELRGTYAGLAHPAALDRLADLGITTVELMPVQQFAHEPHLIDAGRRNYWGYHPFAYFAPHAEYAAAGDGGGQVAEFKRMVQALHGRGLEVLVDVVYNHTGEGNHLGPMLNLKGLDNATYYHLVGDDPRYYMDFTGTGNSLNLRHPVTVQLVMDSLRYWVQEMHVDGFRFDLASTLARGLDTVDTWAAFFAAIHQDPVLQRVKLIAEPWDVGENGYQVGNFPVHWSEWNDRYRETVRGCWSGHCQVGEVAQRISGSADLFSAPGRRPSASINYVCSHDGHTLRDLVEAQVPLPAEGDEAAAQVVEAARRRRQRNLLMTVLLSRGTPMLAAGDEWGRSQQGHDNAYDQDNEISWLDWAAVDEELRAWVRNLIAVRGALPWTQADLWDPPGLTLRWLTPDGVDFAGEDWSGGGSTLTLHATLGDQHVLWACNFGGETVTQALPQGVGGAWQVIVDSGDPGSAPRTVEGPFALEPDRTLLLTNAGAEAR